MATLGDVATWGSGGTPKRSVPEYFGEGMPWLSISDLDDDVVCDAKESLTPAGLENSTAKVVPPGTLFVAMYGSIGKLGVAGREMCTSQAIAFAKPHLDVVESRYLFHYLLSQRPALQARGRGGTQANIGQGDLKQWVIPLPSLDEQRRIAAILDHADALRAKRRQVLAHLDDLTQSIFHDMFGDPAGWSARWSMTTIGAMAESVTYGTSARAGDSGEWLVLRMGNITDQGRISTADLKYMDLLPDEVSKYTVRRGDMLFNRTNSRAKVGKTAVVRTDDPMALAGYLVRVRFYLECSAEFVSAYLMSRHGVRVRQRLAKAAVNQANISASEMKRIAIASPPPKLQAHFAERVLSVEEQRAGVLRAAAADDELFASLQDRAFKGEL